MEGFGGFTIIGSIAICFRIDSAFKEEITASVAFDEAVVLMFAVLEENLLKSGLIGSG